MKLAHELLLPRLMQTRWLGLGLLLMVVACGGRTRDSDNLETTLPVCMGGQPWWEETGQQSAADELAQSLGGVSPCGCSSNPLSGKECDPASPDSCNPEPFESLSCLCEAAASCRPAHYRAYFAGAATVLMFDYFVERNCKVTVLEGDSGFFDEAPTRRVDRCERIECRVDDRGILRAEAVGCDSED